MSAATTEQHLAALLDAVPDPDYDPEDWNAAEGPRCGACGPGGDECRRSAGHYEDVWPVNKHVSFDSDHYADWPVGWKSSTARLNAVLDPAFGTSIGGSPEYRAGARDVLALVRSVLGGT